ncbi:autotransporter assembly complex family protein [Acinetobacter sp.]|uniref:autotransporter assembly complex protein TamA n=1 Tax=Acinetobacter sp. TaxID=472 RepID=UPI00264A130A|nr:BamA/TamA family outer membrane protein [Acinetobacter sp.]MDN5512383.1 BamA/TamA family outer membrane protein [Acinetobacter sp.]MDN5525158.1 BamA/TamA family outer membrane protein [Acinetobacter sp.]
MLSKLNFQKSTLSLSVNSILQWNNEHKRFGLSLVFMLLAQHSFAQVTQPNTPITEAEFQQQLKKEAVKQGVGSSEELKKLESIQNQTEADSLQMLEQQQQATQPLEEFKPIEFEDLEELPITPVSADMANEIFRVAEEAKKEAQQYRAGQRTEAVVSDATQQELVEINQAPVNIDQLMSTIQADSQIVVEANEAGKTLPELAPADEVEEPNFFKRWFYKIRPPRQFNTAKVDRISADVIVVATPNSSDVSAKAYAQALDNLKTNLKAKLSSFTQESFSDFPSALPQLRTLSNQAAQAMGFYNAEFKFEKLSENRVRVRVTANAPVQIKEQNIELSGAGENQPQFQVIRLLPDQDVGDIFNHGLYEQTKTRINDAASNNGFFDGYWRLHDVKVAQPQNTADVNLRYETGERYKLGPVEFRMSDPTQPLPIDMDVLQSMVSWEDGADYTFWRVNGLANNLTNSRYFNYTLVNAVHPDPIEKSLELPPDIQALVDQQKISESEAAVQDKKRVASAKEVTQSVADETQFAGKGETEGDENLRQMRAEQEMKDSEEERLKVQAREEKKIPVIVTLNADRLNSAELGAGYGTDTGTRLRGQYRRAIVNRRGHSFDANVELSQIRQSIDGHYNIPYHHPINDYISIVGGYEHEQRDNVAQGNSLQIESAVAGVDRIIKKPRGSWQHTFGLRYRLDQLTQNGEIAASEIPDTFLANSNEQQQSLLFGYEASRTTSDKRVNPGKGFKQTYKVELGSESLLSDADMAILNAGWRFIYSLGENDNHQFVGRGDLGYILTKDFSKVPYNLRYFTGGDQTIRGFDYKSLSPEENGFKIGGQALAVGSLEYNYQFKEGWRAAIFSDVGNAYDKTLNTPTAYSVGLGLRWASPIGPIRVDVASGISDDNHPIRLHFFIGSQL